MTGDQGRAINMASNENCLGPSPLALKAIHEAAENANRYPHASGEELRFALAQRLRLPADQIVVGNGSTELVEIIARCYLLPSHSMVTAKQTFLMYRLAAHSINANCLEIPNRDYAYDLTAISNAISGNTRLIFIANPNNPTGMMVSRTDLDAFLAKVPREVLIVMDEAYREYVEHEDYPDGVAYLDQFPNLIILRTFSKIYGLAGLRIGYAVASRAVAARLDSIRAPYNTNLIAQAAAIAALSDEQHVERSKASNRIERDFLCHELEAMNIRVLPSAANFLLLIVGDAVRLYKKLLPFGIFTRSMEASNMPEGLRVTIGTHEENVALIDALKKIL